MSNINFTCPYCSFSKQLPASAEGMQGNCPNCLADVTITASALANTQVSPQQPAPQQQYPPPQQPFQQPLQQQYPPQQQPQNEPFMRLNDWTAGERFSFIFFTLGGCAFIGFIAWLILH